MVDFKLERFRVSGVQSQTTDESLESPQPSEPKNASLIVKPVVPKKVMEETQ